MIMSNDLSTQQPPKIPALSIEKLSYRYGSKSILKNVDLEIPMGQFTVVLGVNGAGKTTLFSLVSTLLKMQEGEIRICGHSISSARTSALGHIGLVFQHTTLDMDLTVGQNLIYFAGLQGLGAQDTEARINEVVQLLELQNKLSEKVKRLSGGQRRRIEIARALIGQPQLLIMDEATSNLDVNAKRILSGTMRKLTLTAQTAILWSTHQVEEIEEEDRVIILYEGEVYDDDTAARLCEKYGKSLELVLLDLSRARSRELIE